VAIFLLILTHHSCWCLFFHLWIFCCWGTSFLVDILWLCLAFFVVLEVELFRSAMLLVQCCFLMSLFTCTKWHVIACVVFGWLSCLWCLFPCLYIHALYALNHDRYASFLWLYFYHFFFHKNLKIALKDWTKAADSIFMEESLVKCCLFWYSFCLCFCIFTNLLKTMSSAQLVLVLLLHYFMMVPLMCSCYWSLWKLKQMFYIIMC